MSNSLFILFCSSHVQFLLFYLANNTPNFSFPSSMLSSSSLSSSSPSCCLSIRPKIRPDHTNPCQRIHLSIHPSISTLSPPGSAISIARQQIDCGGSSSVSSFARCLCSSTLVTVEGANLRCRGLTCRFTLPRPAVLHPLFVPWPFLSSLLSLWDL